MKKLALIGIVLLGTASAAVPLAAQTSQRSGTAAGGPGAYGRPGELAPGTKPQRHHPRARSRKPGQLAPGEVPLGAGRKPGPHARRPGEIGR